MTKQLRPLFVTVYFFIQWYMAAILFFVRIYFVEKIKYIWRKRLTNIDVSFAPLRGVFFIFIALCKLLISHSLLRLLYRFLAFYFDFEEGSIHNQCAIEYYFLLISNTKKSLSFPALCFKLQNEKCPLFTQNSYFKINLRFIWIIFLKTNIV